MLKDFLQLNARSLVAVLVLVVAPFLVDSAITAWLYDGAGSLTLAGMSGPRMLGYFAVTAALMGLGLTHTTFVALVSGYFLGWEGFAGTVGAYALAAATGYRLARLIDHGALHRFLHLFPRAEAVIRELEAETLQLITDAGRVRGLAYLGIAQMPPKCNWATIRAKFLIPKALGLTPWSEAEVARLSSTDKLAARLLKQKYDLPVSADTNLTVVLE